MSSFGLIWSCLIFIMLYLEKLMTSFIDGPSNDYGQYFHGHPSLKQNLLPETTCGASSHATQVCTECYLNCEVSGHIKALSIMLDTLTPPNSAKWELMYSQNLPRKLGCHRAICWKAEELFLPIYRLGVNCICF